MSALSQRQAVALAACAVAAMLVAGPAPADAANTCKSWAFIGQAVAPNQTQAKALARADWKAKVTAYFNVQWANWALASNKWEHCERNRRQQRCQAHGIPCTPGLGLTQ